MYLDLDGFKAVNDSLGHSMGDILLQQTALRLKGSVRNSDTVARFGGDEFAVSLTNISKVDDVRRISEKIRKSIQEPYELEGAQVSISTSIGCSLFPDDSEDPQILIDLADRAMYRVKYGTKNGVAFHEN